MATMEDYVKLSIYVKQLRYEDMRWPQGFDPATSRYGKMISYCSRIELPCHRSRGHSWITNGQLHASPRFVIGCYHPLRGEYEEAERGI